MDPHTKGRLDHLQNISLKGTVHRNYKEEDTLKEYAEIHLKSNKRFISSANRILLVLGTSSLFAADASCHKPCYEFFRSPWWKRKIESSITAKSTVHNDSLFYGNV